MRAPALVTNFAYGTGPYLRTTELALALNDELEKQGKPRRCVVVPWVYGEKQRRIMLEQFGDSARLRPEEVLLDARLGALLREVFFYGTHRYEEALERWLSRAESVSRAANGHLSGPLQLETLAGAPVELDAGCIELELNRSPRIFYDVAPAYSTTFGYVADILERAARLPPGTFDVRPELLGKGVELADAIEGRRQELHFMSVPGTFSWEEGYADRYDATLIPPITDLPRPPRGSLATDGLFVTVTGIDGLERLYREARALGLALYTNDTQALPDGTWALPSSVAEPAVLLHFARAGWGSLWLSMFTGCPILVPAYDKTDDPEIYFNNIALNNLGFGSVYAGQELSRVLAQASTARTRAASLCETILGRWGSLNGNEVCAKMLAERIL